MNTPLSNIISEVLEPVTRGLCDSDAVLSSETLLHLVDKVNKEWEQKPDNGARPLLIAADASFLYPSLDHTTSAEMVSREVILSDLDMKGVDWRELAY